MFQIKDITRTQKLTCQ